MKKSFYIIPLLLGLIFVSCDKDDSINERLDIIEKTHLTTINEQIENINNTIETFEETDVKLEEFIKSLQVTASSLQKSIDETNVKINNIKSELPNEIGTAKNEVLAELTSLKKDTENKLSQINTTIASLQAKEAELDKKITDLKNYVDTELSNNKDWAKATFATLEQYSTLASEIATIKSQIARINNSITELENHITEKVEKDIAYAIESFKDSFTAEVITNITDAYQQAIKDAKTEISDAYTANIATAISKLETSMQTWVSEKLKEYYTIAEVEGKIAALMTTIDDGDKATMQELKKMAESIAEIKEEVTTNYTKAIKDAINKNN